MEELIKKMLETWVSRNDCCFIDSYNFIRKDVGHYTVSVMEKDREQNVFLSMYWIEINEFSFRIIEIE